MIALNTIISIGEMILLYSKLARQCTPMQPVVLVVLCSPCSPCTLSSPSCSSCLYPDIRPCLGSLHTGCTSSPFRDYGRNTDLNNIAEYKYFELIFMSLITEAELTEIIMQTSDNKTLKLNDILN